MEQHREEIQKTWSQSGRNCHGSPRTVRVSARPRENTCHTSMVGATIGSYQVNTSTDTLANEQERGVTIKSTAISLCAQQLKEEDLKEPLGKPTKNDFQINLVDSPGQVDASSKISTGPFVSQYVQANMVWFRWY